MTENKTNKIVCISNCNFCGRPIKDDWKFCPYCKTPVEVFKCEFCGKEIRANWHYCPECKSKLKVEQINQQRVDKCNDWLRDILNNK